MHSEEFAICQRSSSLSVAFSGRSHFLRRVCFPKSCGPPTSLCQQHRRFFWRKWKKPYSVVRPTTVRPAYEVPTVSDLLPLKQYFFLICIAVMCLQIECQVFIKNKNGSKICFIAETSTWNINPVYLSFLLSDCSTL